MRTKISAVAVVVTAFLMSVAGVASATTNEFESSVEKGTIESHAGTWNNTTKTWSKEEQEFKAGAAGNMEVNCKHVTNNGTVTSTKATEQIVKATYTECKVGSFKVSNIKTEYRFHSENGEVDVLKPVIIKTDESAETEGETCTVEVPAQNGLKGITYSNVTGPESKPSIEINAKVTGIKSKGESKNGKLAECQYPAGTSTGTYNGFDTAWVVGASISWT